MICITVYGVQWWRLGYFTKVTQRIRKALETADYRDCVVILRGGDTLVDLYGRERRCLQIQTDFGDDDPKMADLIERLYPFRHRDWYFEIVVQSPMVSHLATIK